MRHKIIGISLVFLLFLWGCIEPFEPELGNLENSLTVTGSVLSGKHISTIELGRTFGFDETESEKVTEADVRVVDDLGNEFLFREKLPGIYRSDTTEFQGVVGRSYQLNIRTQDGQELESDFQLMVAPANIDNFYFEEEILVTGFDTLEGIQVLVDASNPEKTSRYYRWEFEETWIVQVPFPQRGLWDVLTHTFTFYPGDSIPTICYAFDESSRILLDNSLGLEEDRIQRFPLVYISGETNRLSRRYSILLKQYNLNEAAYNFWTAVEESNENLGTLFDPIPNQLIGNIRNVSNPEETVLGYFSADGYSEKRIFIDRLDFDPNIQISTNREFCELRFFERAEDLSRFISGGGSFAGLVADFFGNIVGYTGSSPRCTDCREQGELRKPSYWR